MEMNRLTVKFIFELKKFKETNPSMYQFLKAKEDNLNMAVSSSDRNDLLFL